MNILVFDTETIGFSSQDLLNIGYRIVDIDMATYTAKEKVARDYLISNIYKGVKRLYAEKDVLIKEIPSIMSNNFAPVNKVARYDYLLKNKQIVSRTLKTAFSQLSKDIKKYKPAFGYAFNSQFDTDKFARSAEKYNLYNPLEDLTIYDIWSYATNYIVHSDSYINWAMENKIFSESKMHISSSVESITKYLLNNLDFKEQHTALDDTKYELLILLVCIKEGADITKYEKKGSYIPTNEIFTDSVVNKETGEIQEIKYKKKVTRNGVTTYYN